MAFRADDPGRAGATRTDTSAGYPPDLTIGDDESNPIDAPFHFGSPSDINLAPALNWEYSRTKQCKQCMNSVSLKGCLI